VSYTVEDVNRATAFGDVTMPVVGGTGVVFAWELAGAAGASCPIP